MNRIGYEKMATADISFWCFNKLNDWATQWKNNEIWRLAKWKVMVLKSKGQIAADSDMWLTHPSHSQKQE